MKTVYKTSTKKKGKNKMSKVTIDVDVANPQIRSVCLDTVVKMVSENFSWHSRIRNRRI